MDSSCELTATLKLYCITHNTLPFFIIYNIYINVVIYIHIC